MKTIIFCLFLSGLINVCTYGQQQNDTIQWLKVSAFDLGNTDPDVPITDIPFEKILASVDLVLAGEATHGTKEFAQMKHRLFRHLVENLGFRYFLIEADFAAGLIVDDYISNNVGDAAEALKALRFFHIVNREGLELIKWMRVYNEHKNPHDRIRFFGIDCQYSEHALIWLKKYIGKADPAFYHSIHKLNLTDNKKSKSTLDRKYPTLTLNKDSIEFIKNHLLANRELYQINSSERQYNMAVQLVELLRQAYEVVNSVFGFPLREKFMATNVVWLLDEMDPAPQKSFLWAHNLHVAFLIGNEDHKQTPVPSLGMRLKERFGEKVYTIGFDFNNGSFIANEIRQDSLVKRKFTVDQAPSNTFSSLMSGTDREVLFIDFKSLQNPNLVHWLKGRRVKLQSNIGGTYFPLHRFMNFSLLENFNGLIFVKETTEVTLGLD